jgi:hypothetical protein
MTNKCCLRIAKRVETTDYTRDLIVASAGMRKDRLTRAASLHSRMEGNRFPLPRANHR